MDMRKFYADTIQEALELVRRELGDDALILDTQTSILPGDPPRTQVEVWAIPAVATDGMPSAPAMRQSVSAPVTPPLPVSPVVPGNTSEADKPMPPVVYSGGIHPGSGRHLVAFIGPHGTGKTTMLVKLAWHFGLERGMRVGVISADTIRVGAREQIRAYCAHLELPLEILYRPEQFADAAARLHDCSLLLLDTPGGNPHDADYMAALEALLSAADPAEVHLVLGAEMSAGAARDMLERYQTINPDQVILTRLDLLAGSLEMLSLLAEYGLAVSYLGTGARIPEGWALAAPHNLPEKAGVRS